MKWSVIIILILTSILTSTGTMSFLTNPWSTFNGFFGKDVMEDRFKPNPTNTGYWLYTRKNPSKQLDIIPFDDLSLVYSYFDPNKTVVVLVHGWKTDGNAPMNKMLTEAFLKNDDVNVFVIDWSEVATQNIVSASHGVLPVGTDLGSFINWMVTRGGASYDKIHLVGHSIGAHIVGIAGQVTWNKVRRITGLDPARSMWIEQAHRLTPYCAQYVEAIHTNILLIGMHEPCGHADFYPNGGALMPGCILPSCSHSKAYEYMAASVVFNNLIAKQCRTLQDITYDTCDGPLYPMGNSNLSKFGSGIFRINTKDEYPFAYL